MKCTIASANIKVLGRAIHSLSKIGDDVCIEALACGVIIRAVNSSRSAYACFNFAPVFFSCFNFSAEVTCKVSLKYFLLAFRSLASLEKSVDKCSIDLTSEQDKLVLQFFCKYGMIKTYHLPFIECEILQASFHKSKCENKLIAKARLLADGIQNFNINVEEVTLSSFSDRFSLRNYVDDEPDPNNVVHTELTMEPEEFEEYKITEESEITFCLKELRAILSFSEGCNSEVAIYFQKAGRPIIFSVSGVQGLEADFVLASLAEQSDTQTTSGTVEVHIERTKKNKGAGKKSKQRNTDQLNGIDSIETSAINSRVIENNKLAKQNHEESILNRTNEPSTSKVSHEEEMLEKEWAVLNNVMDDCAVIDLNEAFDDDEPIPGTPPAKRFRSAFLGLSQSTEYTSMAPDPDEVLAEDSEDD